MRLKSTLLIFSLLALGCHGAPAAAGTELLPNGDFSTATKNPAWPDDWKQKPWTTWEAGKGSHYLRFVANQPGKNLDLGRDISLSDAPGIEGLRVTVRYRTHDLKIGAKPGQDARLSLAFSDAVRIKFYPPPAPIVFSPGASAWTVATASVRVPAHAVSLALSFGLNQVDAGTLDVASISLKALPAADVPPPAAKPSATASSAPANPPIRREGDRTIIGDGKPTVWFIHPYVDVLGHDFDMGIDHLVEQARAQGHPITVGVAPSLEPADEQDEARTIYVFTYKNINYPLPANARRLVFLNTWLLPAVQWPAARTGHRDLVLIGSRMLHNNGDGLATNKDRWMQIRKSDPTLTVTLLDATGYYLPMGVWRTALLKVVTDL